MSTEDNKALARRYIEEVFNQKNLTLVDELNSPDFVFHNASTTIQGREPYKAYLSMILTAYPDLHMTIEDMIAEGDKVVTRLTAYGKHAGDMFGIQATDNDLEMKAVAIHRVVDGQIVEHWSCKDELGFLQQLGVIPRSEPAAPPGG